MNWQYIFDFLALSLFAWFCYLVGYGFGFDNGYKLRERHAEFERRFERTDP